MVTLRQFFYQLYLQINLAASWFAMAFAIEALLLIALGIGIEKKPDHNTPMLWLFVYAMLIHPLTGLLSGRNWQGTEIFGLAPDPTALATLAILSGSTGIRARILSLY